MTKSVKISSLLYEFVILILLITGIILYRPSVFLFIPLLVSVAVMFLQSQVNRYAFLLGAFNAILYAVSYLQMSLYATAVYAILVSCPIQLMTFLNWNRHTVQHQTSLRKMSVKIRCLTMGGILLGFLLLYLVFSGLNSQYWIFDNGITILGIVTSILCLLRFQEYLFLQILCNFISLSTFAIMTKTQPSQIIWVIHSTNAIINSCMAFKQIKNEKSEV